MFSDERKTTILNLLSEQQRVTVVDVASALDVSETTVRRDLQDLEHQGLLKRTHGGAVPVELSTFEPSVQEKSLLFSEEKSGIAALAVRHIGPGDAILLDAGTTTLEIARQLSDIPLTVATNSLEISFELSKHKQISQVVIGGELRSTTGALVGAYADYILSRLNVDKLFLGANGVHLERGITTANSLEAATKQAMIAAAREVYLVIDHSKLEQVHMAQVCHFRDVDYVLCDSTLPAAYEEKLQSYGIKTIATQS